MLIENIKNDGGVHKKKCVSWFTPLTHVAHFPMLLSSVYVFYVMTICLRTGFCPVSISILSLVTYPTVLPVVTYSAFTQWLVCSFTPFCFCVLLLIIH